MLRILATCLNRVEVVLLECRLGRRRDNDNSGPVNKTEYIDILLVLPEPLHPDLWNIYTHQYIQTPSASLE